MNNHFDDSLYYLHRAAEHAKLGLEEQLEPVETRVRELTGHEAPEPEPNRLESVSQRVETEARGVVSSARERLAEYQSADGLEGDDGSAGQ